MKEHQIIAHIGRYTLLKQKSEIVPFVVACGYNEKTREWGAGFYFKTLRDAMTDFNERIGYACLDCKNGSDADHPTFCMKN